MWVWTRSDNKPYEPQSTTRKPRVQDADMDVIVGSHSNLASKMQPAFHPITHRLLTLCEVGHMSFTSVLSSPLWGSACPQR